MSYLDGTSGSVRVLYNNLANNSIFTLAATTEATTHEKENAVDGSTKNTWRSTAITQTYYTLNGVESNTIAGCYILNHNITGGTVTFNLESSDNNFSSIASTTAFTTVTRKETELVKGVIKQVTYNDAYAIVALSNQDYRISMMQTATNTYHEIGKIYLFGNDFTFPNPCYRLEPERGAETIFTSVTGAYGTQNDTYNYQHHIENFEFPKIPVANLDECGIISANSKVIYMPDGLTGKHFYGRFRMSAPREHIGGQYFVIQGTFDGAQ